MKEYPRKTHLRAFELSLYLDCLGMWIKEVHPNIFGGRVPIPLKLGKDFGSTSMGELKSRTCEGILFIGNVVIKMAFP